MKTFKSKTLRFYNRLIMLVLVLMGFSACDDDSNIFNNGGDGDDIMLEYGTPQVSYRLKGKVVNEANKPVRNIQLIIKTNPDYARPDTLYSKGDGQFEYQTYNWSAKEMNVVYTDLRNEDIVYKTDSVSVVMGKPTGGDGRWNQGEASKEIVIKLKEKKKDVE